MIEKMSYVPLDTE